MKEKEIAAFVIDFVKGRGSALGCQLGAELHVKFPGTNFRLEYGGVRRFIDSNCHGEVVRTGTRGGDDIYSHVSNTTNEIKLTELQHPDQVTEWDVFQKPGNRLQLLVNPTSGMTKNGMALDWIGWLYFPTQHSKLRFLVALYAQFVGNAFDLLLRNQRESAINASDSF